VRKPGPLTEEEWLVMHSHPVIGARVLGTSKGIPEVCAVTAFEHHIRNDRSGYPKLTRNRPLHFYTMMMSIVDTYDSLTTARPYRAPVRPEQAVGWMLYSGASQFEPRLLTRFATLLRMYPVGAVVQLDTDEWGVITSGSQRDLSRPTVRLVVDNNGQLVRGNREVDLAARDHTGDFSRSITGILQPCTRIAQIASVLNR
jgi:HD-GYP domain-containing protein (c-di-GMP phosphodiesterase class II)